MPSCCLSFACIPASNAGDGRILVLLLDTSCGMWDQLQDKDSGKQLQDPQTLGRADFCQQILLFLNTYLILQEGNKAAVFAVDGSGRLMNLQFLLHSLLWAYQPIDLLFTACKSAGAVTYSISHHPLQVVKLNPSSTLPILWQSRYCSSFCKAWLLTMTLQVQKPICISAVHDKCVECSE